MNAKRVFLTTTFAYLFLATISGCSESTKEATLPPELTSTVNFPYIKDNSLYSFDPETGESEKLFTAEQDLILALDIDSSSKEENDDNTVNFVHTAKVEYFAYANTQTLHLYDLNTRIDHQLYDFKKDLIFDPTANEFITAPESYICDIQKVITWDEESRLAKKILYKDEFAIYVKTSTNAECQNTETPFSYWQIDIEESPEELTRRRKILLEHSHDHTHFHDHDDENYELAELHDHTHRLKKGELDENGIEFDPNNHEHTHKHSHDFMYGAEHAHELLSKNVIDAVHNNPKNQEIIFESHPKLIGKKTTVDSLDGSTINNDTNGIKVEKIDEALMYSGKPVLDIDNRIFGYLGFNTTEKTLKFFVIEDPKKAKPKKKLLWQLTNNIFNTIHNDHSKLSDLEKTTPKYTRFSNFEYANKDIFFITNNRIFFFSLADLFDDDTSEEREASLANPLFTSNLSTPQLTDRVNYNPTVNKMAITEGSSILSIDFSDNSPEQANLITKINEPNLASIASSYISNNSILVEKTFYENDIKTSSMVIIEDTGLGPGQALENQVVLLKTLDSISTTIINNNVLINLTDNDSQNRSAEYFTLPLITPKPYYDSIWGVSGIDYRNYTEQNIILIASSDTSPNAINSIARPKLYSFDDDHFLGQGEDFGYIPQDIIDIKEVVMFSNLYGLAEVKNIDSSTSTYFFSNEKSSFNFDNEYKNMKPLLAPTED